MKIFQVIASCFICCCLVAPTATAVEVLAVNAGGGQETFVKSLIDAVLPDVMCVTEASSSPSGYYTSGLNYHVKANQNSNAVILSKTPLVRLYGSGTPPTISDGGDEIKYIDPWPPGWQDNRFNVAVGAKTTIGGVDMYIACVHLDPSNYFTKPLYENVDGPGRKRKGQIDAVLATIDNLVPQGMPVIILGDFNSASHLDWSWWVSDSDPSTTNYPPRSATVDHRNDTTDGGADWYVSRRLHSLGYIDSANPSSIIRQTYSQSPVVAPPTWKTPWKASPVNKDNYTPEGYRHERIDRVYSKGFSVAEHNTYCGITSRDQDELPDVTYLNFNWPTDHRAVGAVLSTGPATCSDGIQNQDETGVDCGGVCPACPTCSDGIQNQDETGVDCGGVCPACPTCSDGIQNQDETGVDCGGVCPACPGTCSDGIQNQDETGVDCGGVCPACPGTCSDGIQNQDETGVDCGGVCPACPTCSDGIQNQDETEVDCGGVCPACPTCSDGIQNQDETGVDCGGVCPACPTCSDGIQNQDETGVDCGGVCPACSPGGSLKIFVTSSSYTGDLGGLAGADAKCDSDSNKPSGSSTYKAFVSHTSNRIPGGTGWIMLQNQEYTTSTGVSMGTTDGSGKFVFNLSAVPGILNDYIWTGIEEDWSVDYSCSDWTTGSGGGNWGNTGNPGVTTTKILHDDRTPKCNTFNKIMCVEQ